MNNYVPVYENPVTQSGYEGIAEYIDETVDPFTYEFGGKKFINCVVKFVGEDKYVTRIIDNEYIQFVFKGKRELLSSKTQTLWRKNG